MSHYMLAHLIKNRESDKFRGFSYRKTLKDTGFVHQVKNVPTKVIAWDVYYKDEKLIQLDTLKEVNHYIKEKANT